MKNLNRILINTLAGSAFAAVTIISGLASASDLEPDFVVTLKKDVIDARRSIYPGVYAIGGAIFDQSTEGAGGGAGKCPPREDNPMILDCPFAGAVKTKSGSLVPLNLTLPIHEVTAPVCGESAEGEISVYMREFGGNVTFTYTYTWM